MRKIAFIIAALFASLILHRAYAESSSDAVKSLKAKIESWDVEEIWPEVEEALSTRPQDPELLALAAQAAFYRGEYQESLNLIKRSIEADRGDEMRRAFSLFVQETINVLAPYKSYESPHFKITLEEKQDGILIGYLADALEKTYTVMEQRYGFKPGEKVRVELFPDARAFYLASTLSQRDIEVAGAVGLAKFNKLQLLSPAALLHGYRWLDAISHEYMHYLIVKMTANRAPVWFHEGLAKYEETRWRNGPAYLSPLYETLLAEALLNRKLLDFSKMEPSLVHLETPEKIQLAYAQSASAIEFIVQSAGHEALGKIMDLMAQSEKEGAGESIEEVTGLELSELYEKLAEFLRSKDLKPSPGAAVHRLKIKEEKSDEERMELEEIKSLVARNRAHLGDRLRERGRTSAAVLEYRRALSETGEPVPVMNRLSSALIELNRDEEALEVLKRTLEYAPDHSTPRAQLGFIYMKQKDFVKAIEAFEESIQINPFNPVVHAALANAYEVLGNKEDSRKERDIARELGK